MKSTTQDHEQRSPVVPHGASSNEKALLAIHSRSSERGIPAFSRKPGVRRRNTELDSSLILLAADSCLLTPLL
jgi:hypothetical protein